VASGWTPVAAAPEARAQASSLYYLGYYAGSSVFGWLLGVVFGSVGWFWFLVVVLAMCAAALGAALVSLRAVRPSP
jgi:predicted MFS family arabinose efflux permease